MYEYSFQFVLLSAAGLGLVYIAAWLASRAFFDNKADYNRKLLQTLEEKTDVEKEG